jgi:hypothetical protein
MKYPEKDIFKDLYSDLHSDLVQQFAGRNPVIQCQIQRSGVNWHCTVKQGEKFCSISCFPLIPDPQYLISFQRNSEEIALGRTSSKLDVIHAVDDWVNGSELGVLYDNFLFVDRHKRSVLGIRDDLVTNLPELSELVKIKHELSEFCQLWFEHSDRSAYVCFSDDQEEILNITGYWNKSSELFGIQSHDRKLLAEIVKRWVCDRTLPSEIRTEFPSIQMSKAADFYEQGNPIAGEFIQSWDSIETSFNGSPNIDCEWLSILDMESFHPMLELFQSMRREGYDQKLRAGQAMCDFCLSRARSHGKMGLSYLTFRVEYDRVETDKIQGLQVVYYTQDAIAEEFVEKDIVLTDRIRNLLQKLSEQPIYSW